VTGLVLRISQVAPLPDDRIAAGCRDAGVDLRDQTRAPERVLREVPVDDLREALVWLRRRGPAYAVDGRRCSIVAVAS
jgi:hypothetical protein